MPFCVYVLVYLYWTNVLIFTIKLLCRNDILWHLLNTMTPFVIQHRFSKNISVICSIESNFSVLQEILWNCKKFYGIFQNLAKYRILNLNSSNFILFNLTIQKKNCSIFASFKFQKFLSCNTKMIVKDNKFNIKVLRVGQNFLS